jgi:autotransporter-associated beta strand protein
MVGVLSTAGVARAEEIFWSGAGLTSNWTNPNNWLGLNVPGNNGLDDVFMRGAVARSTNTVNDNFSINRLRFRSDGVSSQSWTLNAANSAVLSVGDWIVNEVNRTVNINVPIRATGELFISNAFGGQFGQMNFEAIDLNGQNLVVAASSSGLNLNGAISGIGEVNVREGTVSFRGTNTWSGELNILEGATASIRSNANLGSGVSSIDFINFFSDPDVPTLQVTNATSITRPINFVAGEGLIDVPTGVTVSLTAPLSGDGHLGKTGAGLLSLNATNGAFQQTTVYGGTLRLIANQALPENTVRVLAGATLIVSPTVTQAVTSLDGDGAMELLSLTTFLVGSGQFNGPISGSGTRLVKQGTGTLVLTGSNTYAGTTDITGGTLVANNSGNNTSATGTSAVNVNAGGRLAGDGRVAGSVTVASGGQLAPSNASTPNAGIGLLDIGGSLHVQPGGHVLIDFDNATFDRVSVVGAGTLNGELHLSRIGTSSGPNLNTSVRLIGAQGSVTGVFSSIQGVSINAQKSIAVTYSGGVFATIARPGDVTLDERVDFSDLLVLAQNYGGTGIKTWASADLTGDGTAGFSDLLLLSQNYQSPPSFQSDWAFARAMVPEPAMLSLLLASGLMLRRHTRSSSSRG